MSKNQGELDPTKLNPGARVGGAENFASAISRSQERGLFASDTMINAKSKFSNLVFCERSWRSRQILRVCALAQDSLI